MYSHFAPAENCLVFCHLDGENVTSTESNGPLIGSVNIRTSEDLHWDNLTIDQISNQSVHLH